MSLLVAFLVIAVIGQGINVGIALFVEQYSAFLSTLLFFVLLVVVFLSSWILAVRVTEPKDGSASSRA